MKNVKVIRRGEKTYLYFQRADQPLVKLKSPLPDVYEGSALEAEVGALQQLAAPKPLPGTLKAAIRAYELSADFRSLADSTKYEYRLILSELEEHFGTVEVSKFAAGAILKLRDTWSSRGHRAANVRIQVLKNVLTPAIIEGLIGDANPFSLIAQVRRPHDAPEPHILWPEIVFETVIRAAIERRYFGLARAIALARYVGPRRSDLVKISRAARQDGRVRFLSGKRKVPVNVEEDPHLTAWLEATPPTQPLSNWQATRKAAVRRTLSTPMTIVFNMEGVAYTDDGLGQALARLIDELFAAQKIDSGRYDFHGLRHTRGVELALAGCSDAEGAAALGHRSPSSFAQYRRQADKIRLSDSASDKIRAMRERRKNA